jgi:hypothetical protein
MRAQRLARIGRVNEATVPTTSRSRRAGLSARRDRVTRGVIVGWKPGQGVLVELGDGAKTGARREVLLASTMVPMTADELDRAAVERRTVMLVFEDGDRKRPAILGLLAPVPAPPSRTAAKPGEPAALGGDVVIVRGRDSIELRCGDASITLRKDGKILVRGTNVTSRASKENRVVGGSIHFN